MKRKRRKEPEGNEPDAEAGQGGEAELPRLDDSEAQHAEDLDSARLVDRFHAGETDAFATLYTRYFNRVFAYFRMVLHNREDAEDATQQIFTQAFEALPRYERRREPFRGWLFTIARNHAISELRKEHPILLEPEEIDRRREREGPHEPALDATRWLSNQDFLFLIEHLPIPQRQVLVLRYMLDLTGPEIASILDREPGAIRALQHRAVTSIKDRLIALGRAPANPDPDTKNNNMRRWPKRAPVIRARRWSL